MADNEQKQLDPIAEERAFLHAMATPLATMSLLIESMIETAENSADAAQAGEARRLQQLFGLLQKVNTLLRERRSVLIARSTGGNPPVQS